MPPRTRSYSQLRSWTDCAMRYYLERVLKRQSRGDVFRPAGTAVHETVEDYLRSSLSRDGQ